MTKPPAGELAPVPVLEPRDQVIAWLLEGHRDGDIREAIKAKLPGLNAESLMMEAVEHFAGAAKCDTEVIVGWGLEAYRDLYRRMIKIGDFANAMKAVNNLVALAVKHCVPIEEEENPADEPPPPEPAPPAKKKQQQRSRKKVKQPSRGTRPRNSKRKGTKPPPGV